MPSKIPGFQTPYIMNQKGVKSNGIFQASPHPGLDRRTSSIYLEKTWWASLRLAHPTVLSPENKVKFFYVPVDLVEFWLSLLDRTMPHNLVNPLTGFSRKLCSECLLRLTTVLKQFKVKG
jgi:hypothetical protein